MSFWDEYLKNPPPEVKFSTNWGTDPEACHCVQWVGYGGEYEADELWNFGSGSRWIGRMPPEMDFTKYGGETLCGLKIDSGRKMYGPRWRSIAPRDYNPVLLSGQDRLREVLTDLYGITCMVCRKKLVYGICQIIDGLTSIRSRLVGDWLGEEYISREPLIHGKYVISVDKHGNIRSETFRHRCRASAESINPQLVDDAQETDRITCPDCLANLAAGVLA